MTEEHIIIEGRQSRPTREQLQDAYDTLWRDGEFRVRSGKWTGQTRFMWAIVPALLLAALPDQVEIIDGKGPSGIHLKKACAKGGDMPYQTVILKRDPGIGTLVLNRPEVLNALNPTMMAEVAEALDELLGDEEIRAIIITGAGRGFCSGADVRQELGRLLENYSLWDSPFGRVLKDQPNIVSLVARIRNAGVAVIAAVNGMAAGAGFSLAAACDMRVASEQAEFCMAFIKRGLIPDVGGTYFLPRLLGPGRACELILTGKVIDACEADRIGLVNRVVPHEELMPAAEELARSIAENPPLAVRLAKRSLYWGLSAPDLAAHLEHEVWSNRVLMDTDDFREGVRSFLEKRDPEFKGS